jgi:hypothetical protein
MASNVISTMNNFLNQLYKFSEDMQYKSGAENPTARIAAIYNMLYVREGKEKCDYYMRKRLGDVYYTTVDQASSAIRPRNRKQSMPTRWLNIYLRS